LQRAPPKEDKLVYSKMDLEKWEHQEFLVEDIMVNQENSTLQSLGTEGPTSSYCITVHQLEQEPHVLTLSF